MRRTFFFIFTLFLVSVVGCRASREVQTTQQWHQSSNIDVEAHRLDSLWSLLVERYHVHIEYYTPNEVRQPETDTTKSLQSLVKANWPVAAPRSTKPADGVGLDPIWGGIGGLGAVKSIDIEAERTQSEQSLSQADSTAVSKTESESAQKTEKASEARQDNGTVIGVAIVFAVGLIVYLLLKEFLKK
ncbi:MAG: hypothetical protein IJ057_13515 [Bacteroidales bacterium]|nr:hypothetical protein [Bacteroidales bacterium]